MEPRRDRGGGRLTGHASRQSEWVARGPSWAATRWAAHGDRFSSTCSRDRAATRERIAELDDALRRMDAATYGVCERCRQPIAEERLAVRPFARCCVSCA
ncbi:TraR/DksA family transcriptional regulator [Micromonospora zhanjiangensis]